MTYVDYLSLHHMAFGNNLLLNKRKIIMAGEI
jgi:hypothetical protein